MPVMLCGFIPEDEWLVLAELSYFFRVLCAQELLPGLLEEMEELARELICMLERIFLLVFFNPMQHLILHLPTEARFGGARAKSLVLRNWEDAEDATSKIWK